MKEAQEWIKLPTACRVHGPTRMPHSVVLYFIHVAAITYNAANACNQKPRLSRPRDSKSC